MSETPPPPPTGGDPEPPTTPYPQQPTPQGWQPPYGQPTYGQAPNPQVPYGAAQVPAYGPIRPDHPQATTVLILGIVGIVACGIAAPFAWVMGNRVVREIDASGGTLGGRSNANVGRILGIVATVLMFGTLVLGLLGLVVFIAMAPA
jgi:hypothetical protein